MKPTKEEYRQRTRPNLEEYDLLVLGSGTTGKLISWTLVKFQQRYEKRHGSLPKPICAKRLCLRGTPQFLAPYFHLPLNGAALCFVPVVASVGDASAPKDSDTYFTLDLSDS